MTLNILLKQLVLQHLRKKNVVAAERGWVTAVLQPQHLCVRKCCKITVFLVRGGATRVYSPYYAPEPHSASTVWGIN